MTEMSQEETKETKERTDFAKIAEINKNAALEIEGLRLSQKENYSTQSLEELLNWLEQPIENEELLEIIEKSLKAAHIMADDEKTNIQTEINTVKDDLSNMIHDRNFITQFHTKTEGLFEFCKALSYFSLMK